MEPVNFDAFVDATATEAKAVLAKLKLGQQLIDHEKTRIGTVVQLDLVGYETCDVEVVGTDVVMTDVPVMELFPHSAFRFRAGQRIHVDGWIGIIKELSIKVKVKRGNGRILKFRVKEESAGTFDSFMSNGHLPTFCDRFVEPGEEDLYSAIGNIPYPGSQLPIVVDLSGLNQNCKSAWKDLYYRCAAVISEDLDDPRLTIVKNVKVSKIKVEWESAIDDSTSVTHRDAMTHKHIVKSAEVLAPASQDVCEERSSRMYVLKGGEIIMKKKTWLNRKLEKNGAPRSITFDEVDLPIINCEWQKEHGFKIGDYIAVKVLAKNRLVEVTWDQSEETQTLSLEEVKKMIPEGTSPSCEALYEVNIDSDSEEAGQSVGRGPSSKKVTDNEETTIPWLQKTFRVKDFVVDGLREFPSDKTVYGVIKKINRKEFTALVDWYEVDEVFHTKNVLLEAVTSIFDLIHMDEVLDPLFRIVWKRNKNMYGSEIVCSRFGMSDAGFCAGYFKEINDLGQIIATSDSSLWNLWPCEIERLSNVAHQNADGEWVHCPNDFHTSEQLMKRFLPDYRLEQIKQKELHRPEYPKVNCTSLEDYPKLRKMPNAPTNHKYFEEVLDPNFKSDAQMQEDPEIALRVEEDLNKTLKEMEGKDVYFCIYEDHPELVSALICGKPDSVFEGAIFLFDIYYPRRFPKVPPKVDYVCYASGMNPVLHDARASQPIQLMMFLIPNYRMTGAMVKVETDASSTNETICGAASSFPVEEEGQGDYHRIGSSTDPEAYKHNSLSDYIWYIYEVLFTARADDVFLQLYPEGLTKEENNEYYYFLLGKKLEALANLTRFPYDPWAQLIELFQPKMMEMLKEAEDGIAGLSSEFASAGSLIYLKRRMAYLKESFDVTHSPTGVIKTESPAKPQGMELSEELQSRLSSSSSCSTCNSSSVQPSSYTRYSHVDGLLSNASQYNSENDIDALPPPVPPRGPPPPPPLAPASTSRSILDTSDNTEDLPGPVSPNVGGQHSAALVEMLESRLQGINLDDSINLEELNQNQPEAESSGRKDPAEYCSSSSSTSL